MRIVTLLLTSTICLGLHGSLNAQEALPPQEPIIRLNAQGHTSRINAVASSPNCEQFATASTDGTIRVWSIPLKAVSHVLRAHAGPSVDPDVQGLSYNRDGSLLAAGVSMGRGHAVYVYDARHGRFLKRIPVPDGLRLLDVGFPADSNDVIVTTSDSETLLYWSAPAYEAAEKISTKVAFDTWRAKSLGHGLFVQSVSDRSARIFKIAGGKLTELRRITVSSGYMVGSGTTNGDPVVYDRATGDFTVLNSVEGSIRQTGRADALGARYVHGAVHVNALHKRLIVAADTDDTAYGDNGPQFDRRFPPLLNAWDLRSSPLTKTSKVSLSSQRSPIAHVASCGDHVMFAEHGGGVSLRKLEDFNLVFAAPSGQLLLDGLDIENGVSDDATVVQNKNRNLRFDLVNEEVTAYRPIKAEPPPFSLEAVKEKLSESFPQIVKQEIRSYDAKKVGTSNFLVIATRAQLHAFQFDASAFRLLWSAPNTVANTVKIAGSNKLLVAFNEDGTLHWHRMGDGRRILTAFFAAQPDRWIAWTESGYYVASAGADTLAGWQINRTWDVEPDFIPLDRLRSDFNRPDVVKATLELLDEREALKTRRVDRGTRGGDIRGVAPPVVVVQNPPDGAVFTSPEITLQYDVTSRSEGDFSGLDVRIGDAEQGIRFVTRALMQKSGSLSLNLPRADTVVTLVARQGDRMSEPAQVRLKWGGPKTGEVARPRLRLLAIGVSAYESSKVRRLVYPAKDAADIDQFFRTQEGKSYTAPVVTHLLQNPKRQEVIDNLEWLLRDSNDGDVNFLFLAGHGMADDGDFYFLTADSDPDRLRSTAISREDLARVIQRRKGAMVVALDTCYSGASADQALRPEHRVNMHQVSNALGDRSNGAMIFASSLGRQTSQESAEWGNGAFTKALLEGLRGRADRDLKGRVYADELAVYIRNRVGELTNHAQTPVRVKPDAEPEMVLVSLK